MTRTVTALIWAAAILLTAIAGSYGWISRDSARTMLIVMPILAFVILIRRSRCRSCAD